MDEDEAAVLKTHAPAYVRYMLSHPGSYLTRFYGLYSIQMYNTTMSLVVMANVFAAAPQRPVGEPPMDERYDLKGSWIDRNSSRPKDPLTVRKDNDLNYCLHLTPHRLRVVRSQMSADVAFLSQELNVMDYSLIVGVRRGRFAVNPEEGFGVGAAGAAPAPVPVPVPVPVVGDAGGDSCGFGGDPRGVSTASGGGAGGAAAGQPPARLTPMGATAALTTPALHGFRPATPASAASAALSFSPTTAAEQQRQQSLQKQKSPSELPPPRQQQQPNGGGGGGSSIDAASSTDTQITPSMRASMSAGSAASTSFVGTASPLTSSVSTAHTLAGVVGGQLVTRPSPSSEQAGGYSGGGADGAAAAGMNEEEETSPTALWMTDAEGGGRPLLAPPHSPSLPAQGGVRLPNGVELASIVEGPQAYHVGIIDILQVWSLRKRLERFAKTWLLGKPGRGISATPPLEYAQRFTERVICDVFDAPLGEQMEVESASQAGAYRSQSPSHSLGQSPYQGMLPEAAIGAAGR